MKQAMPAAGEFDKLHDFLSKLEEYIEDGTMEGESADEDAFMRWIHDDWDHIGSCWRRVLWAGNTAIFNACDPSQGVLEWKPEIKKALEAAGIET